MLIGCRGTPRAVPTARCSGSRDASMPSHFMACAVSDATKFGLSSGGRGHLDRGAGGGGGRAVALPRGAVRGAAPPRVRGEQVVDVHGGVVAPVPEVHAPGQPVDDAGGEQPELLLVVVEGEGQDELF